MLTLANCVSKHNNLVHMLSLCLDDPVMSTEDMESAMEVDCDECYFELDADIYQLVSNHAPVTDIVEAWTDAYGELQCHPRVENCESICVNILACFAVHYEHVDLVIELIPLCSPYCGYSPHITAMNDSNVEMDQEIDEAMFKIYCDYDCGLNITWDTGKRLGYMQPSKQGFGCITDNMINIGKKTSVFDILLQRDDLEGLEYVLNTLYSGFLPPLADMALRYKSVKCLKYLKDQITRRATVKPSYEKYTSSLLMLLGFASCHDGTLTQLHIECALRQWSVLRHTQMPRRFLSTEQEKMLTNLLNGGSITPSGIQQVFPPSRSYALREIYNNVILENCVALISKMTDFSGKSAACVPMRALTNNIQHTYSILEKFPLAVGGDLLACRMSLKLHNTISQLLMQSGLQAPVCHRHCGVDSYHTLGCNCYNYYDQEAIRYFFSTMIHVEEKLTESPSDMDKEILALAHKCLVTLLAHGYIGSYKLPLYLLSQCQKPQKIMGARIVVSMLPQQIYNSYRRFFYKSRNEYVIPYKQNTDRTEYEEFMFQIDEEFFGMHNAFGLECDRSLKELCRSKLYEIIPKGKMPQFVELLELSREQQDYLALGVRPMIQRLQ